MRITAAAALVVTLGLAVTSVVLVTVVRRDLVRSVDVELGRTAAELEVLVADETALAADLAGRTGDEFLVQVVQGDRVVVSTANVAGLEPLAARLDIGSVRSITVPLDDGSFRMLVRSLDGQSLIVARSLDEVTDSIAILTSALFVAVPALTLALAALVWLLVGRTLRPVEAIRAEVAHLEGRDDLDRRVPVPTTRDEIARLATTMNEMLGRIERSTEMQRAFVADASHELRIPLTRLRTQLEVEGATGIDSSGTANLLAEVIGLQSLVEDLLYLAQSDAGRAPVRSETVDFDDIVRAEVRAMIGGPAIDLDLEPVMVEGDASQVARAVLNLVDNACRHARSQVTVTLREDNGVAVLKIADDGAGIPASRTNFVFERFARLDEARNTDDGGTGLGLAIVRRIVEQHGGSVSIEDSNEGALFVVRLTAVS